MAGTGMVKMFTFTFLPSKFNDRAICLQLRVKVGLGIFCTGQLCNLFHHYKLANLRSPGSYRYVVPSGGLFGFVVCPQYCGLVCIYFIVRQ